MRYISASSILICTAAARSEPIDANVVTSTPHDFGGPVNMRPSTPEQGSQLVKPIAVGAGIGAAVGAGGVAGASVSGFLDKMQMDAVRNVGITNAKKYEELQNVVLEKNDDGSYSTKIWKKVVNDDFTMADDGQTVEDNGFANKIKSGDYVLTTFEEFEELEELKDASGKIVFTADDFAKFKAGNRMWKLAGMNSKLAVVAASSMAIGASAGAVLAMMKDKKQRYLRSHQ